MRQGELTYVAHKKSEHSLSLADGKTYFHNGVTNVSSWEKPDCMKSNNELLLAKCPWKEYKAENGKVTLFSERVGDPQNIGVPLYVYVYLKLWTFITYVPM